MTAPRISGYDWRGGSEAMLRFGPERGPTVIAALPLFEEANRTRAAIVDVLRRLAVRGIGGALPDLPGLGESLLPTDAATLTGWRTAFAAAARALPGPVHAVAWRGGALVDVEAAVTARWHLSPISGADTMRELRRVRTAAGGDLFAGNRLSDVLIHELETDRLPGEGSEGSRTRVIRLATDPRPADAHLPGRPLWRAAEPGTDPVLQTAIADDIAGWIAACVA